MQRQEGSLKRFTGAQFEGRQAATLKIRQQLLPVLGLEEGQEEWFEMPVKKSVADFAAVDELANIEGLNVVHFIERPMEQTPAEVLNKVRGTIVWNREVVVRQSIPYRQEFVLEKLPIIGTGDDRSIVLNTGLTKHTMKVSSVFIRKYSEGTIIDIMKLNGKVQWFTSRNLVPKGVKTDTDPRWIHQPAKWGSHIPFTVSAERIMLAADPLLLDDRTLFPKKTKFSNRLYRFILTTRQRVRADADPVGPVGYLTYLGCFEQWSNNNPPEALRAIMGEPHLDEDVYKPIYPNVKPDDVTKPFIVQYTESLTPEKANEYLQGNTDVIDKRFSGGGKLIITGKVRSAGGKMKEITWHVKSLSYQHRETIIGNSENLYKQFLSCLDVSGYNFNIESSVEVFHEQFASLKLPGKDVNDICTFAKLKELVLAEVPLPIVCNPVLLADNLKARLSRLIWYNFLLCANVSIRPTVLMYLPRYVYDLAFISTWLLSVNKDTNFSNLDKDKEKAAVQKSFIFKTKTSVQQHYNYHRGEGVIHILESMGEVTPKLITLAHRINGSLEESIRVSEPDAEFGTSQKVRPSYASKLKMDGKERVEETLWNKEGWSHTPSIPPQVSVKKSQQKSKTLKSAGKVPIPMKKKSSK
jgi:hypothetical protein